MKRPKKVSFQPNITLAVNDFPFLKKLVEKLACQSEDNSGKPVAITADTVSTPVSSIEAYMNGTIVYKTKDAMQELAFGSCFFFTCIQDEKGSNHLTWCHSLS